MEAQPTPCVEHWQLNLFFPFTNLPTSSSSPLTNVSPLERSLSLPPFDNSSRTKDTSAKMEDMRPCSTCKQLLLSWYAYPSPFTTGKFRFVHLSYRDLVASATKCPMCRLAVQISPDEKDYDPEIRGDCYGYSSIHWTLPLSFFLPGVSQSDDEEAKKQFGTPSANVEIDQFHHQVEIVSGRPDDEQAFRFVNGTSSGQPDIDQFQHQYEISGRTDDEQAFKLAKFWIDSCAQSHPRCKRPQQPTLLPTRVLDVGTSSTRPDSPDSNIVEENVYLLDNTDGSNYGQYVTLSHRWPPELVCKTMKCNIEKHCSGGVPLAQMPPTFRDAVRACRRVGVQYLWIDSLCIIQDCDTDWMGEAPKMGSIYGNSLFTISALGAAASPSSDGLFFDRSHLSGSQIIFDTDMALENMPRRLGLRRSLPTFDKEMETSPLNSRGWIYQERVLSTATLHYGKNEMLWECRSLVSPECSLPLRVHTLALTRAFGKSLQYCISRPKEAMFAWFDEVKYLSFREFTKKADRGPAVQALASRFAEQAVGTIFQSAKFAAGMWADVMLHRQLLWRYDASDGPHLHAAPRHEKKNQIFSDPRHRSSSWSWTSVDYPVRFWLNDYTDDDNITPEVFFVSVNTHPDTWAGQSRELGAPVDLVVRGRALRLSVDPGMFEDLIDDSLPFIFSWNQKPSHWCLGRNLGRMQTIAFGTVPTLPSTSTTGGGSTSEGRRSASSSGSAYEHPHFPPEPLFLEMGMDPGRRIPDDLWLLRTLSTSAGIEGFSLVPYMRESMTYFLLLEDVRNRPLEVDVVDGVRMGWGYAMRRVGLGYGRTADVDALFEGHGTRGKREYRYVIV